MKRGEKSLRIVPEALPARYKLVDFLDVLGTRPAIRLFDFELYVLARFSDFVVVHHKSGIVEEVVLVVFGVNETIPLLLVEHFNCSLHENPNLPSHAPEKVFWL